MYLLLSAASASRQSGVTAAPRVNSASYIEALGSKGASVTATASSVASISYEYALGKTTNAYVPVTSSVAAVGGMVGIGKSGTASVSVSSSMTAVGSRGVGKTVVVSASRGIIGCNTLAEIKTSTTIIDDTFDRTDLGSDYTVETNPDGPTAHSVGVIHSGTWCAGSSTVSACAYVGDLTDYGDSQWIEATYYHYTYDPLWIEVNVNMQDGNTNYVKSYGIRSIGYSSYPPYFRVHPHNYIGNGGEEYNANLWPIELNYNDATSGASQNGTIRLERVGHWIKYYLDGQLKLVAPLHQFTNTNLTGGQPGILATKHSSTLYREYYPCIGRVTTGSYSVTKLEDRRVAKDLWRTNRHNHLDILVEAVSTITCAARHVGISTASVSASSTVTATEVKDAVGAVTSIQLNDNETTVALTDGAELDLTTSTETI